MCDPVSALRKVWIATLSLVGLCAFASNANSQAGCTADKGSGAYVECLHQSLVELRAQMDRSYQRALSDVPNFPPNLISDSRKELSQLRLHLAQSQAAWQTLASESCAYAGGIRGGSSTWINIFELQCLIEETKARIDRLEHLPSPS